MRGFVLWMRQVVLGLAQRIQGAIKLTLSRAEFLMNAIPKNMREPSVKFDAIEGNAIAVLLRFVGENLQPHHLAIFTCLSKQRFRMHRVLSGLVCLSTIRWGECFLPCC
jgi:hypothetical protein